MNKSYVFKFNVDNKALTDAADKIESKLSEALSNGTSLDRSGKAAVKQSLGDIFGIAEEQAALLQKTVQGIVSMKPEGIEVLKNQLKETLEFASGIMTKMKVVNDSSDWMKQGIGLIDDFKTLQAGLETVQKDVVDLKSDINELSASFKGFEEAFKSGNPTAYFRKFGGEAQSTSQEVVKAQAVIQQAIKKTGIVVDSLKKQDLNFDFSGLDSGEKALERYNDLVSEIQEHIEALDTAEVGSKYFVSTKANLEGLVKELIALSNHDLMPKDKLSFVFDDVSYKYVSQDLQETVNEITKQIKQAGDDLTNTINNLNLKEIEIKLTLPDASSAEFTSKINTFIEQATKEFEAKPITVSVDLANPIKEAKTKSLTKKQKDKNKEIKEPILSKAKDAGLDLEGVLDEGLGDKDTRKILAKFWESLNKVTNSIQSGQKLILEHTKKWKEDMKDLLTLTFTWAAGENKADIDELFQYANQVSEEQQIYLNVDTEDFIKQIEDALKDKKFNVNVNAGNIEGSIVGNFVGGGPVSGPTYVPVQEIEFSDSEDDDQHELVEATEENGEAVKQSTKQSKVLRDAIKGLTDKISTSSKFLAGKQAVLDSKKAREQEVEIEIQELNERIQKNEKIKQEAAKEIVRITEELTKEGKSEEYIADVLKSYKDKVTKATSAINYSRRRADELRAEINYEQDEKLVNKKSAQISADRKKLARLQSIESNDDIAKIILEEIGKFWKNSNSALSKSVNDIKELSKSGKFESELEELSSLTKSFVEMGPDDPAYQEAKQKISDLWTAIAEKAKKLAPGEKDVVDENVKKVETWLVRQSMMISKGLVEGLDIDTITNILKHNGAFASSLKEDEVRDNGEKIQLKSLQPIKDIMYFAQLMQKNLGVQITDVNQENAQKALQERFVYLFQILQYLEQIDALVPKDGSKPTLKAVENFINSFKAISGMEEVVNTATEYLTARKEISAQAEKDENFKAMQDAGLLDQYLPQNIREIWLKLPEDIKVAIVSELGTLGEEIDRKKFEEFDGSSPEITAISKILSAAHTKGAFGNIKSDVPEFAEFTNALTQFFSFNAVESKLVDLLEGIKKPFEGSYIETKGGKGSIPAAIAPALYQLFQQNQPISVKVVDSRGNETIYSGQPRGRAAMDANKNFNFTRKGLDRFLNQSGLKNEILSILSAAPEERSALIEELFSSGRLQVSSKSDPFVKTSSRKLTYEETDFAKARAKLERMTAEAKGKSGEELERITKKNQEEVERCRRILADEDKVIEGLIALQEDIKTEEARVREHGSRSRSAEKTSDRLTSNSKYFNRRASYAKRGMQNNKKELWLPTLFANLGIAEQYGTMDANAIAEIRKMMADGGFTEAPTSEKYHALPDGQREDYVERWKEVRKAIIDKYYSTEGWFVTNLLRERMATFDVELQQGAAAQEEAEAQAQQKYDAEASRIQSEHSDKIRAIDSSIANMRRIYLEDPLKAIEDTTRAYDREIEAAKKANQDAKSRFLTSFDKSTEMQELKERLYQEQENGANGRIGNAELRRVRKQFSPGSEEFKEYTRQIEENEAYYSQQINEYRARRIAEETKKFNEELNVKLSEIESRRQKDVQKGFVDHLDPAKLAEHPEWTSPEAVEAYITEQDRLMREVEEKRFEAARAQLEKDLSEGKYAVGEVATHVSDPYYGLQSDGKWKSDAQVMADTQSRIASSNRESEKAENERLVAKRSLLKTLKEEYEVSDDLLDVDTQRAGEASGAASRGAASSSNRPKSGGTQTTGGYWAGGASGFVNASNLATESTLRGIYELLNGGSPVGGWDSTGDAEHTDDMSVSSFSANSKNFAESVRSFVESAKTMDSESMVLFNKLGQIGNLIKGGANGIDGKDISSALTKYADKNVKIALHNHPDGMTALSPADIQSATGLSGRGVGISGSVANGIITAVDFSRISKEAGLAIKNKYEELIKQSDISALFDLSTFEIIPGIKLDQDSKNGLSHILNELLKKAIESVTGVEKADGILHQFKSKDAEMLVDMVETQDVVSKFVDDVNKSNMKHQTPIKSLVDEIKASLYEEDDEEFLESYYGKDWNKAVKYSEASHKEKLLLDIADEYAYDISSRFTGIEEELSKKQSGKSFNKSTLLQDLVLIAKQRENLSDEDKAYLKAVEEIANKLAEERSQYVKQRMSISEYLFDRGVVDLETHTMGKDADKIYESSQEWSDWQDQQIAKYFNPKTITAPTKTESHDVEKQASDKVYDVAGAIVQKAGEDAKQAVEKDTSSKSDINKIIGQLKNDAQARLVGIAESIKNKYNVGGKWSIEGAEQLYSGMFDSEFGLNGSHYDFMHREQIARSVQAYNSLQAAMQSDIAKEFDADTTEFIKNLIESLRKELLSNEKTAKSFGWNGGSTTKVVQQAQVEFPVLSEASEEATRQLAAYVKENFTSVAGKGKAVAGASKISQGLYNAASAMFKSPAEFNDQDRRNLAVAWDQLNKGTQEDITKKFDSATISFIEQIKAQVRNILDSNNIDDAAIRAASVAKKDAAKNIAGTLLTKESVEKTLGVLSKSKETGSNRAKKGLEDTYRVLSNGKENLSQRDLKDLASGYFRLVETIKHKVFSTFSEDIKTQITQAKDVAERILRENKVQVIGGELVGKTVGDDNRDIIANVNKNNHEGNKITSVAEPAIKIDGELVRKAQITTQVAEKKAKAEKKVTQEKKTQDKVLTSIVEKEEKSSKKVSTKKKEPTAFPVLSGLSQDVMTQLAEYIKENYTAKFEKGKAVEGGYKIEQGLRNAAKTIFKNPEEFTDEDKLDISKAIDQLTNGLGSKAIDKLVQDTDQNTKAFIELVKFKVQEIIQALKIDADAIRKANEEKKELAKSISGTSITKEAVDSAYTDIMLPRVVAKKGKHDGEKVPISGAKRAKEGLKNVYGVLASGKETLSQGDLKELGSGYFRLVESTSEHIFSNFNEDTQRIILEAMVKSKEILDANGVSVLGTQDLINQVITKDTLRLVHDTDKFKGDSKIGAHLSSMTKPALLQTVIGEDGSATEKLLQQAEGTLTDKKIKKEKEVTSEKKKQNALIKEGSKKESEAASSVERRANAEKNSAAARGQNVGGVFTTPPGKISVPVGGNNGGGFGNLARETTLSSILEILKAFSSGKKNDSAQDQKTSKPSKKKGQKQDLPDLTQEQAFDALKRYIGQYLPEFNSMDNLRSVAGGYALDVVMPKDVAAVKAVREELKKMQVDGKVGTSEWVNAQTKLNGLLHEQEKITLRIDKTNEGNVYVSKTVYKNMALGAKAAFKEIQQFETLLPKLLETGAVSIGENGSFVGKTKIVNQLLESEKALQEARESLTEDGLVAPENQQRLNDMSNSVQTLRMSVLELLNISDRLNGEKLGVLDVDALNNTSIKESMMSIVSASTALETKFGDLIPKQTKSGQLYYELSYSVKNSKRELQEMTAVFNPLTGEIIAQSGALKHVQTGWDNFIAGLKSKYKSIIQYTTSITSIYRVWGEVRRGFQYVREIDVALTELKKVTDETDATYKRFLQDMAKTASVVGSTTSELTSSAADWARLNI